HAGRLGAEADLAGRGAAAVERRARRDELDRAETDTRVPGRAVHAAPAQAPGRPPGSHRLGPGAGPRVAALGRADRARRLVRRPSFAVARREDPRAHAARALRRDVQGQGRRVAGWRRAPANALNRGTVHL